MTPWTDRSGRIVPIKLIVFAGAFVPGLALAWALWAGTLGPKAVTEAIHETGDWAIRFLLISLAVTPLRRIADWPKLIVVRRMLGLTALAYAIIHLTLYIVDQNYNLAKVGSEIVLRVYLTIGFVALLGLAVLGATSTDAAIRRMGRSWNRLHRIVYAIGVLAVIHFFLQTKLDVSEATLMSGLFVLLMAYRVLQARGIGLTPIVLAVTAIAATMATMAIEYVWYTAATGVDPGLVFRANFDFSYTVRPAWWVGVTGLGVAMLAAVRKGPRQQRGRRHNRLATKAVET